MVANLNVRKVQETMEDSAKQAQELGRKAYFTYLGVWGMSYDGAKALYKEPKVWVGKAEKRGKVVEKELRKIVEAYRADFPGEASKLAEEVQEKALSLGKEAGHMAEEWAKRAEKTISKVVGYDSSVVEKVEEIAVEAKAMVKNLNGSMRKGAEKSVEAAAVVKEAADSAIEGLWKGYDEMGVKDIVSGLEGMEIKKLEEVRKYEAGSKNRVTILREIDARLQAMTS